MKAMGVTIFRIFNFLGQVETFSKMIEIGNFRSFLPNSFVQNFVNV